MSSTYAAEEEVSMLLIYMLLGFLGGRAWWEMRGRHPSDYEMSSKVGGFSLVSIVAVGVGQFLFWRHVSDTAEVAIPIALGAGMLFGFFYRLLIRTLEILTGVPRALVFLLTLALVATNGWFAGHELAMLPFKDQVVAQANQNATGDKQAFEATLSQALDLPNLRQRVKDQETALQEAREAGQSSGQGSDVLRDQALACEQLAAGLQGNIPVAGSPGHAAALGAWRRQAGACSALRRQADALALRGETLADANIGQAQQSLDEAKGRLNAAEGEYTRHLAAAESGIRNGAVSGIGRHRAFWAAIEAGTIPVIAYGWVLVAMLLEGMGFLAKLFLPFDQVAQDRRGAASWAQGNGELRLEAYRTMRGMIPGIVAGLKPQMEADLRVLVQEVVLPGLHIETAAEAFESASARVRQAQDRAGPSSRLMEELAEMAARVRGVMSGRGRATESAKA